MSDFRADLKIIVIGNTQTGKTSFINKLTKNIFNETYKETVVSEFGSKIFEKDDKLYRVQLWDLSGQDKILKITKIYAKDAHGCIIFSDSTNIQTRKDSIKWKQYVDESASFFNDGKLPCILVESKSDLLKKNENYEEEIKKFAEENGFDGGFTVSSKEGININESFEFLMNTIIERMELMLKKGVNCFIKENNFVNLEPKKLEEMKK